MRLPALFVVGLISLCGTNVPVAQDRPEPALKVVAALQGQLNGLSLAVPIPHGDRILLRTRRESDTSDPEALHELKGAVLHPVTFADGRPVVGAEIREIRAGIVCLLLLTPNAGQDPQVVTVREGVASRHKVATGRIMTIPPEARYGTYLIGNRLFLWFTTNYETFSLYADGAEGLQLIGLDDANLRVGKQPLVVPGLDGKTYLSGPDEPYEFRIEGTKLVPNPAPVRPQALVDKDLFVKRIPVVAGELVTAQEKGSKNREHLWFAGPNGASPVTNPDGTMLHSDWFTLDLLDDRVWITGFGLDPKTAKPVSLTLFEWTGTHARPVGTLEGEHAENFQPLAHDGLPVFAGGTRYKQGWFVVLAGKLVQVVNESGEPYASSSDRQCLWHARNGLMTESSSNSSLYGTLTQVDGATYRKLHLDGARLRIVIGSHDVAGACMFIAKPAPLSEGATRPEYLFALGKAGTLTRIKEVEGTGTSYRLAAASDGTRLLVVQTQEGKLSAFLVSR